MPSEADIRPRSARLEDMAKLEAFEQGVIAAEREYAFNLRDQKITYYDLIKLIESDESELVVLECEQELIGCGYARIENDKPHFEPEQFAYLGFMYVVPQFRGQGLLKTIVDYLVEWSNQRGIITFKLDVFSSNQPAIRAYSKLGFKPHMVQMWYQRD